MAPRMNDVLKAARTRGMLVIHCPRDTMDFYKDHPAHKLAQGAATSVPLLRGYVEGKDSVVEPVAWVNTAQDRRMFCLDGFVFYARP